MEIWLADVHGNKKALENTLRYFGVIDKNLDRIPGVAKVGQVGDLMNGSPIGVYFRGFVSDDYGTLEAVLNHHWIDPELQLVGNHDIGITDPHLGAVGYWFGMAPQDELHPDLFDLVERAKEEGYFRIAAETHGWLITHAGVTNWDRKLTQDPKEIADNLNRIFLNLRKTDRSKIEDDDLRYLKIIVGDREDPSRSCVWVRPEYFYSPPDFGQIVGHTPDYYPRFFDADFFKEKGLDPGWSENSKLWIIDTAGYMAANDRNHPLHDLGTEYISAMIKEDGRDWWPWGQPGDEEERG